MCISGAQGHGHRADVLIDKSAAKIRALTDLGITNKCRFHMMHCIHWDRELKCSSSGVKGEKHSNIIADPCTAHGANVRLSLVVHQQWARTCAL